MEGIGRIKERIIQEAQEKKQQILSKAEKEAEEILESSRQKAEEIRLKAIENAKKAAEDEKRKIISMAELEERKRFLGVKQQLIDQVFDEVKKRLENMEAQAYRKLLKQMLVKSNINGDEELIIAEKDKSVINAEFLKEVNSELEKLGKKGNLKLSSENRTMIGGFILKSKDFEINNSFDSFIKIQREDLETQIAKILFGE